MPNTPRAIDEAASASKQIVLLPQWVGRWPLIWTLLAAACVSLGLWWLIWTAFSALAANASLAGLVGLVAVNART